LLAPAVCSAADALAVGPSAAGTPWPWWLLAIAFFAFTCVLGVVAALAGIGGSVLYVPLVAGFMPFIHVDFVRGAGLMVALSGALSAGPALLRAELVNLRLAIPLALTASIGAIAGALIGLALPAQWVQLGLGAVILSVALVMWRVKAREPDVEGQAHGLARLLGIEGRYWDAERGATVHWRPRALGAGVVLFGGVGVMAGLFGLGAGWANVPLLNLLMAVPLRIAVATSFFLLAITDTAAALIYFQRGAMLAGIVVPSVLGIVLGARLGTWLLQRVHSRVIRRVVIGVLLVAGLRALLRGVGI
jgi:uncharacterized membrane protein YfcA